MKKIIPAAGLALLALGVSLALAAPVYASHCDDGRSVFGGDYELKEGEVLDSNLVVLGGDSVIEDGATVNCSVIVLGGSVTIAGAVKEDVTVLGGDVNLKSTAVVEGEVSTLGGAVDSEEGATVKKFNQGFGPSIDLPFPIFSGRFDGFNLAAYTLQSALNTVASAVAMGLLALLVALFWPEHTARVGAAITGAPAASGGLGLLTLIAVPVLLAVAALTICLSPFTVIGALVFAAALIFGWIALGTVVGVRLAAALNLRGLSPAVSAGMGTLLFSLAANTIGWIVPCVGWLVPTLLAVIGLGAVTLTRFGTRPYLPGAAPPPLPPPAEPAPDSGPATLTS
jgi:hypothetical protein